MLNNTVTLDVALYIKNRNMEAGTCSQKCVFSPEPNLRYPFASRSNLFHEGILGVFYAIALHSI
jgi:hypothetical protein